MIQGNQNIKIVLCVLLLAVSIAGCKKKNNYLVDPTKYVFPIAPFNLTEDVRVGAYYSVYKAADWNVASAYTPELGKYDASTASVMQQHIAWANAGGVNFFVLKWNGVADNTILNTFKEASQEGVKMVIEYNTAHLSATNASPLTGNKLLTLVNDFKALSDAYITSDAYYKVDSKPVIILTPLNLSAAGQMSIDYQKVSDTLRTAMKTWGYDPYIIGQLTTGWVSPLNFSQTALMAMDGVVASTWSTTDYDRSFAFYSYSDLSFQNWKNTLAGMNVDFVPCIFPGWNNPSAATQYVIPRTEKNYVDYCNVAKRSMGKNRLVLVNSWNDFQKGNTLEPAAEYGLDYLNITLRELKKR